MALYNVVIDKQVRKKDLPPLPTKYRDQIVARIIKLADDPFPNDSMQLKGREERRIRQGAYRILYIVKVKTVTVHVVKVGHRSHVYKA